jgi:surface protein
MFYDCENFNCDLSQWNVSNVKDMECMFQGCKNFNCGLNSWDVSNVKNMGAMFYDCENFNKDLSRWNITKARCTNMFVNCPIRKSYKPKIKK